MTSITDLTIEDVEAEFVGKLIANEIVQAEANELFAAAKALYTKLPKGQAMDRVCHGGNSGTNALVPHTDGQIIRELIDAGQAYQGTWPSFRYDSDDPEVLSQIEVWTEIIGLAPRAMALKDRRAIRHTPSSWAERTRCDTRQIHGWYVVVSTSRRSVNGWVVKGRGQTIYVLPDPMDTIEGVPSSFRMSNPTPDDLTVAQTATSNEHTNLTYRRQPGRNIPVSAFTDVSKIEPIKFSRSNASVALKLPPELAAERLNWIIDLATKVKATADEVADLCKKRDDWQTSSGKAVERDRKVRAAVERAKMANLSNMGSHYDHSHGLIQTMIADLGEEKARSLLETFLIANAGGPLTPAEEAALSVPPPVEGKTAQEIHAHLLASTFSGLAPRF